MTIPEWLLPTFILLPATLFCFVGVGLGWILALLPRDEWRHWGTILALTGALSPVLVTVVLFCFGTFATFNREAITVVVVLLGCLGYLVAFLRRSAPQSAKHHHAQTPWALIDSTIIVVIVVAIAARFWNTAYWPFATYDEFWVYGYNPKLFLRENLIPATIGYYPQHMALLYTAMQLLWGGINDHAARVVLPWIAAFSIHLTYVVGTRLFSRRVGLVAAALWALYPHHAVWSQFGDLEVLVTLYFTATALCFILGVQQRSPRFTVISGLMLGAALWTKPTAGALLQSVGLIVAVVVWQWWRTRRPLTDLLRSPETLPMLGRHCLIVLAVAFPIGGMWYIRNLLLGLPLLVLPAGYWNAEAQRSGQEFGWPLVIAIATALWLVLHRQRSRASILGAALLCVGILPSAFGWQLPSTLTLQESLLGIIATGFKPTPLRWEYLLIITGAGLLLWAARPTWMNQSISWRRQTWLLLAFIVPYFVTWFWSYSYHFRLSFAIVPLMIVPLAALIVAIGKTIPAPNRLRLVGQLSGAALVIVLALPGVVATLSGLVPAIVGSLPTDDDKVRYGNPALMDLVQFLREQRAALGRPLRISAPGESRLPFFFPDDAIYTSDRTKPQEAMFPTALDQLADVDFFIDSSVGQRLYNFEGKLDNQILRSLTRSNAMQRVFTVDDNNFRFSAYRVLNTQRFQPLESNGLLEVQIGDFAYLSGYTLSTARQSRGEAFYVFLQFKALKPSDKDYSIFIHIWDPKTQTLIQSWDGEPVDRAFWVWDKVPGASFNVAYSTRLWQTGEWISDDRQFRARLDAPPGDYELRVGMYDAITQQRLLITKDGQVVGDSIRLYQFTLQ